MVQPRSEKQHSPSRNNPVTARRPAGVRRSDQSDYAVGALALRSVLVLARRLQSLYRAGQSEGAVSVSTTESLSRRRLVSTRFVFIAGEWTPHGVDARAPTLANHGLGRWSIDWHAE